MSRSGRGKDVGTAGFYALPLGPIMATVNELRGVVHQRHALAGMIYARQLRSAPVAFKAADRGKMRKVRNSEGEKRAA